MVIRDSFCRLTSMKEDIVIDLKYLYILLGQSPPAESVQYSFDTHLRPTGSPVGVGIFRDQEPRDLGEAAPLGAIPIVCGPIQVKYNGMYVFLPLDKQHTELVELIDFQPP
jgi:hypothetical protein